jgi:hypothetical protein
VKTGAHAALATIAVAALVGFCAPAASGQAVVPQAHVDRPAAALGGQVRVFGEGWPGGTLVNIELCGNRALDDSTDCAVAYGVHAGVGADGTFSMLLPVTRPPTNCPCVVHVTTDSGGLVSAADVPFEVIGVPTSPPRATYVPPSILLLVDSAHLEGSGPWTSWFGGAAHRTLVLSIRSVAPFELTHPHLSIAWGAGPNPSNLVLSPTLASFRPHEHRVVRIPVTLDALSWGDYRVEGRAIGYGPQAQFAATTSVYWWGWLVIAFLIFDVILWRVLRRLARRGDKRKAAASPEAPAEEAVLVGAAAASSPAGAPEADNSAVVNNGEPS